MLRRKTVRVGKFNPGKARWTRKCHSARAFPLRSFFNDFGCFASMLYKMIRRFVTFLLWLLGLLLTFVSANIYDPYLVVMRGWWSVGLVAGSLGVLGALVVAGYLRGRGLLGKFLVLLWCLPPVAMVSSITVFQVRKHALCLRLKASVRRISGGTLLSAIHRSMKLPPWPRKD